MIMLVEILGEELDNQREPHKLHEGPQEHCNKQEDNLPLGHRLWKCGGATRKQQNRPVRVQKYSEDDVEHEEQEAAHPHAGPEDLPVAENQHELQEGRGDLHGEQDRRAVRDHAVSTDDQTCGGKSRVVHNVVGRRELVSERHNQVGHDEGCESHASETHGQSNEVLALAKSTGCVASRQV